MLTISLGGEDERRIAHFARERSRSPQDVVRAWIQEHLLEMEMRRRIDSFATLSESERMELRSWAGERATDAQLVALDAEDGGYDWGPGGGPHDDQAAAKPLTISP